MRSGLEMLLIRVLIILVLVCGATQGARAWNCNDPAVRAQNVPGNECYTGGQAGSPSSSQASATAGAQAGAAALAQGGRASAAGGAANASGVGVNGPISVAGGQQTSLTNVQAGAAAISLPSFFMAGCGIGVSAAGGTPKGNGALGIEFTTDECYTIQEAYADYAMGDYQTGCELLHHNKIHKKAAKNGAKIADCALLVPHVVERIVEVKIWPTDEELIKIRTGAVDEYIASHPDRCAKSFLMPKSSQHKRKHVECRTAT